MKIELEIPNQLAQVFDLLEITPQQVVNDFISNLSLDPFGTSGSDERAMITEYFIRLTYHYPWFEYEEITALFDQLNQIRYDFYEFGNDNKNAYLSYQKLAYQTLFKEFEKLKNTRK